MCFFDVCWMLSAGLRLFSGSSLSSSLSLSPNPGLFTSLMLSSNRFLSSNLYLSTSPGLFSSRMMSR